MTDKNQAANGKCCFDRSIWSKQLLANQNLYVPAPYVVLLFAS